MISTTMAAALNEQIKWEMYSANLYLAMSAYLQDAGLTGFSHWMRIQYQEETAHALKFYDFLLSRGGQVTMLSIDAPDANWSNILEIFEETLSHEQEVTRRINELVHLAKEERDFATDIFLQWFVTEQVEEEEIAHDQGRRPGNAASGQRPVSPHLYAASRKLIITIVLRLRPFSKKEFQRELVGEWRRNKIPCGYRHKIGGMQ